MASFLLLLAAMAGAGSLGYGRGSGHATRLLFWFLWAMRARIKTDQALERIAKYGER